MTALSSRAFWVLSEPRICGSVARPPMSAPIAIGPDRSKISLPVSRHKRVGRAGVAKLREQRRVHQLGDQRPVAQRREARLGPANGLAVADRDRAHRGVAVVDDRGDADVDRPRGQHQAGAAKPAHLEVEPAAAIARPGIIEPARGRAREVEARARRCRGLRAAWRCNWAWTSGREPLRPETHRAAAGEGQAGRRKRPPVAGAGQDRGLLELQRAPLDLALAADADPVGADVGQRGEGEGGAAAAGEGGADLAAAVDQIGVGGEPGERDARPH